MARRKRKSFPPAVFHTKIAGVTHENPDGTNRQLLIRTLNPGEPLIVTREPKNRFDKNAIRLGVLRGFLSKKEHQVGYISAEIAGDYARMLDLGGRMDVVVSEVTGGGGMLWWKKNYGVNIKVTVFGLNFD